MTPKRFSLPGCLLVLLSIFPICKAQSPISVCLFGGSTADKRLQAAINSIQAGIIDATCFGGTNQTIAAPVTWGWTTQTSGGPVPDGTGPKTIIFDSATTFTPGSSGLTMFNPGRAGYWRHLHVSSGESQPELFRSYRCVFERLVRGDRQPVHAETRLRWRWPVR